MRSIAVVAAVVEGGDDVAVACGAVFDVAAGMVEVLPVVWACG